MQYFLNCLLFLGFFLSPNYNFANQKIQVDFPSFVVQNVEYQIFVKGNFSDSVIKSVFYVNRIPETLQKTEDGKYFFEFQAIESTDLEIKIGNKNFTKSYKPIPLWYSTIPPFIAILFALLFKEVISALFAGLFSGTLIIYGFQGKSFFIVLGKSFYAVVDQYIINSMIEIDHVQIILFSLLIGGMVNIISANGGMKSLVNFIARYAKKKQSGQFVVWLMGVLIFFDDYANSLVVGNTMRPVTDRLKISREKLAYLVDSTAAPIASLALITTWIGIELSYIQEGIESIGLNENAYSVFIKSMGTRFYPIFTLIFILLLIWKKRDYGPMLKAERNAQKQKHVINNISSDTKEIKPSKFYNAFIPIFVLIFGVFIGLLYSGWDSTIIQNSELSFFRKASDILGNANSNLALLWGSLSAVFVAVFLSFSQRLLSFQTSIKKLIDGFKTMLVPVIILIFAWSLAQMTKDLHTANFISSVLVEKDISVKLLPAMTFIFSALIAFSTGSSWGTMAILYPLTLPVVWTLGQSQGIDNEVLMQLFYNVVSSILAGSVLGDHVSPISDTTILSSLASSCNHIAHVKTQMPYALTVGFVSVIIGSLLSAYGVNLWLIYPLGIIILYVIILIFGKKS